MRNVWIAWAPDLIRIGGAMKKLKERMTDDSRENSIIRFGRAMKQVKGLWFLGSGLIMLVVWGYLSWRFWSQPFAPGAPPPNPFLIVLISLWAAVMLVLDVWHALNNPATTVLSLYSITMFALIAIGLFRLVWSLFHAWGDEEKE
jgi:hypothetical protein